MTTPAIRYTTNLEAGVRISCAPVYATARWGRPPGAVRAPFSEVDTFGAFLASFNTNEWNRYLTSRYLLHEPGNIEM